MRKPIWSIFIYIICMIATCEICLGASYYVEPTKYVGKNKDNGEAFKQLLESLIPTFDESVAENKESADFTLYPKMIETGDSFMLSLEKRKGGKVVFSEMIKIDSLDELDIGAKRLLRTIFTEKPTKESARIGEVTTDEETRPVKRVGTEGSWYLGFGPALASGLGTKSTLSNFRFGYAWEMEQTSLMAYLDSISSLEHGSSEGKFGLGISGNYLFSTGDTSPLVSAGLELGSVTYKTSKKEKDISTDTYLYEDKYENRSGFIVNVGTGLMLFRTAGTNLEIKLESNIFLGKTPKGVPATYGLRCGLYW